MLLFTVQETFNTRMGLILTPAPPAHIPIGSKIKLVFPDASEAETVVNGIVFEFGHIAIPREWADRVMPGVEVWTID